MAVKACLNGSRRPGEHPGLPVTAAQLASAARGAADAGAFAVHVHPRRADGTQTLDPGPCGEAVAAIRAACPRLPVGLSTAAWIEPDPGRRLQLVGG
ncbi:MAG TPA: 3-keto-5-aminohexanoate cleavage protein, partial [Candidatus Eisenbacteria bacterium]|nr:3-keto-5-aminohexanoate cleavage protein [Candidatus Eisenbacteria bacterium]